MDVKNELNDKFLSQDFGNNDRISENLNSYRLFASGYARIENAIAVLRLERAQKLYLLWRYGSDIGHGHQEPMQVC